MARGFTKLLPPQDSLESMKAFISWMVLDQDRAREFETVMRQAAGFLVATARPPLMKDSGIKAMIKELNFEGACDHTELTNHAACCVNARSGVWVPKWLTARVFVSV